MSNRNNSLLKNLTRIVTADEFRLIRTKTSFNPKEYKGKVLFFNGQGLFLVGQEMGTKRSKESKKLKFHLLGGTCEAGETIIECAARELFEETIGLIPEIPVKEALLKIKRENVLVWKQKNGDRLVTQFVFVLPFNVLSRSDRESSLPDKFKQRRLLLDHIFDKQKVPAGKLTTDLKQKVHKELKLLQEPERLSKSFLKHFHEFSAIAWIPERDLFNPELTNPRLINKLSVIQDPTTKKILLFSPSALVPKGIIIDLKISYISSLKKKTLVRPPSKSTPKRSVSPKRYIKPRSRSFRSKGSTDSTGWSVVRSKSSKRKTKKIN